MFVSLVEPGIFATEIFGRNLRRVDGATSPYARMQAAMDSDTRQMKRLLAWADPRRVAETVAEIALSERPRLRYPVGVDAWAGALTSSEFWRVLFEQRMMRAFRG
ncbi:MAG: hypothetical protein HC927_02740 [Deltaproteobacteria bacterium]|nr:hypothetical protein [Deltaproteobacteria bacterium]